MKVPVVTQILKANDQVALEVRARLDEHAITAFNIMASPGAGKTSVILRTVEALPGGMVPAVIEGDIASSIDADTIAARGVDVVQVNTGGNCHLDAPMVRTALEHLDLGRADVLFIENVGNLICPANYRLGADRGVVVASVPEGHDKPYKYPGIFAGADVVVLNKCDLIDVLDFDVAAFERGVRMVNPGVPIVHLSCRTGDGVPEWMTWLLEQMPARV
ncbi:MAG TPA: hydrogenase nickel incorporation protein HypB [Longimicrobiales bacterium]|nr:hydrogenase nickel incorporation protein HypB [Longimicrobiales bacterium]